MDRALPEARPRPRNSPADIQIFQVVGVARNVRDGLSMVATDAPPEIYVPLRPADYARPTLQGIALLMRANPGVDAIAAARREIEAMDNTIKPFNPRSMTEQIDTLLFPVRVALYTYGVIGICGLILASVGLAGCDGLLGDPAPPRDRHPPGPGRPQPPTCSAW